MLLFSLICGANQALAASPEVNIFHGFNSPGSRPKRIIEGIDGNLYGVADGTIFTTTPSGQVSNLYHVDADPTLVQGLDLNLFGTTSTGGTAGRGTVFQLTHSGEFTTLCSFPAEGLQYNPSALVAGSDGNLYGITGGGVNGGGTFFKVTPSGTLTILRHFTPREGGYGGPKGLIEGLDGYLYTLSETGGSEYRGALQQLSKTGELNTIYNFRNGEQNGPQALAQGGDGNFYVSTFGVWPAPPSICQITPAGVLTIIHTFNPVGQNPPFVLVQGHSGIVYGISHVDGAHNQGTLFRIENGTFSTVYSFRAGDGSFPNSIAGDGDGKLYGTMFSGGVGDLGTVYRVAGGHFTTLVDFARSTEGFEPRPLIQGSDGSFFGATTFGGVSGRGTVFRTTVAGDTEILHTFTGGPAGIRPSRLVQADDGNLYGFTTITNESSATLFRLSPAGAFETLVTFDGGPKGSLPGNLIKGGDGNIYGTVLDGGAHGYGMVFQFSPSGSLATVYSFTQGSDGSQPVVLIQGRNGNFYGTTVGGGGSVYRLTPSGALTTLNYLNVTRPTTLVEGADGNLYGTTPTVSHGHFPPPSPPTLFQITPAGGYKTIYTFTQPGDPSALVAGSDGKIYGTTSAYAFSATSSGDFALLHNFDARTEGSNAATLLQGADGNYYGTLTTGGPAGGGAVFQLLLNPEPRPLNLSTRLNVLSGERVLIGGFIITGSEPKRVIIRGIGPSLTGVNGTLQDPMLELHQGSTTLATNDNWKTRADGTSQQAEIAATTISPTNDLESALIATLSPGAYTTILSGKNQGTGVGVVEVYDLGQSSNSKLANISSRGFVDTGDNVMIGGLIVGGSGNSGAKVMIRAIGPSLSGAGITGPLQDPTLELRDLNGALLVSNDDWKIRSDGTSQQAEIEATTIPPTNDQESAIVSAIPPGTYTAIVRGKNSTTGIGLVEVYNLP
ncbi:MAG TPA: choice-of-anchor tandem repeat GloVer-containing protein [Chthoniobacterales bacterium]|nr:choice-of-anchor tandem repeat GloVer-containing protein [Chthoniobacterales bacterium]